MQIRNDWILNESMTNSFPFSLKEGETFFATMKEKLSNHEAVVTIKGQDVHVHFQGEIPNEEQFAVKIIGIKDHVLQVQAVPKTAETKEAAVWLPPISELEKAEQILLAQGIRLSKGEKAILRRFFEKAKGTLNEKLETIQALANKKLEVTELHLQSIHEALHGEPFGEVLTKLADHLDLLPHLQSSEENNRESVNNETKIFNSQTETELLEDQRISQKDRISAGAEATNEQQTELPYWNEEWVQSIPIQAKDMIVKTITEKLSQAAFDFKKLQIEMNKKLENAAFLLNSGQTLAHQQAKQFVEAVIHTLDRAILQGEFMLFTDMKTEKQMLQASAKLAEAKQLLTEGEQSDALNIVNEVKKLLGGLRFQPADVKMKYFVSAFHFNEQEAMPKQQLLSQLARTLKLPLGEEVSARSMFEQFRQLGFQHEQDISRALWLKQPAMEPQNIKAVLMKLSQGELGMIAQQAEHALVNMTGQQLLSKFDTNNHVQTMFYQFPVLLHDQMETVHIYLNSRNDEGKLDWQNCSLYFLLDTEKYGKIGILLQALERNLTITIKTDNAQLSEALKSLTEMAKENLEAIGYNVKGIAFAKMNEQEEQKTAAETTQEKETNREKGYDWTV
ncbi:hypothetical protein [Anoxybacillus flavithermus]|nr:hypothetical protein [Anoxybacillus flavithermus]MBE2940837.1 hypothetical protein [Anoxybacillus flavithermus]MBE2943526.1 hypothetical protein [Anoxybacillus flavithermus]MBE2951837.1 hypothetical protein [Anoxybacillus flavithermus]MBE2954428.1 hypothetical protein [Anoxybacillus flavithermus]MBE2959850.1 hypothetical protein [Anoxybacillus flavithermus]